MNASRVAQDVQAPVQQGSPLSILALCTFAIVLLAWSVWVFLPGGPADSNDRVGSNAATAELAELLPRQQTAAQDTRPAGATLLTMDDSPLEIQMKQLFPCLINNQEEWASVVASINKLNPTISDFRSLGRGDVVWMEEPSCHQSR